MTTILARFNASAPVGEMKIPTFEIRVPNAEPIRICTGYEDQELIVDGVLQVFQATSISFSLPGKNASGQQRLTFSVGNVNGEAQRHVDAALEQDERIELIYREYLSSDRSQPAKRPITMVIVGGTLEGIEAQFEASYYDILNAAWPRERYTSQNAPGIKYL